MSLGYRQEEEMKYKGTRPKPQMTEQAINEMKQQQQQQQQQANKNRNSQQSSSGLAGGLGGAASGAKKKPKDIIMPTSIQLHRFLSFCLGSL